MDFKSLKESLKDIQPVQQVKKKKNETVEDANGYYTLDCVREPYEGQVIKLSGEEFNLYYQKYGHPYRDECAFIDKLENIDMWLYDKPHRVQQRWMKYLAGWL